MQKKLLVLLVVVGIVIAGTALVFQIREICRKDGGPSLETRLADAQEVSVPTPVKAAPAASVRPATPVKPAQDATVRSTNPTNVAAVVKREVAPKTPLPKIANDPKVPKNRQVLLAHRRIVVAEGRKFPAAFCTSQALTARKTAPYVLLSEKRIDRDVHAQAMANGARISGFLPNNALLVEADETTLKNLAEDPAFVAAVEYEPMDKIQPRLLDGKDETVRATVLLMNACYLDAMQNAVTSDGGRVLKVAKNRKSFTAILPRKTITDLAGKGEVRWIEKID